MEVASEGLYSRHVETALCPEGPKCLPRCKKSSFTHVFAQNARMSISRVLTKRVVLWFCAPAQKTWPFLSYASQEFVITGLLSGLLVFPIFCGLVMMRLSRRRFARFRVVEKGRVEGPQVIEVPFSCSISFVTVTARVDPVGIGCWSWPC